MKHSENPKLKEYMMKNFWNVLMQHNENGSSLDWTTEQLRSMIDKAYDSIPEEIKAFIDTRDVESFTVPEICVEVSTKKKGKVIFAEWPYNNMVGTYIELPEKYLSKVYYKQLLHGRLFSFGFHVDNTKPRKFCCNQMEGQFTYRESVGLNSHKSFVKCNINGELRIEAPGAEYALTHCPFCGTEHNKGEKQRRGRILAAIDID
jgi:hypothetical protein